MRSMTARASLPGPGRSPDVLTESAIYVRLVAAPAASTSLEPGNDVCINPERNLLLHRTIEDPPPGVGPVEKFSLITKAADPYRR